MIKKSFKVSQKKFAKLIFEILEIP